MPNRKRPPGEKRVSKAISLMDQIWEEVDRVAGSTRRSRSSVIELVLIEALPRLREVPDREKGPEGAPDVTEREGLRRSLLERASTFSRRPRSVGSAYASPCL